MDGKLVNKVADLPRPIRGSAMTMTLLRGRDEITVSFALIGKTQTHFGGSYSGVGSWSKNLTTRWPANAINPPTASTSATTGLGRLPDDSASVPCAGSCRSTANRRLTLRPLQSR